MAAQTISLAFDGYWRERNKAGVPSQSGVYCVYECTYNQQGGTVTLQRLIYIGEADNVRDRIAHHEKMPDWQKYVRPGNELCYSFAPLVSPTRQRAEAALIYKHKPPVNTEYRDCFPFDETTMSLSGKTALLNTYFTVQWKTC